MDESFATLSDALAERYRLDREIGQGATAVVFLAEDLKHHRPVALKVLRAEITALLGPQRFLHEIELAARLTHPHILPLYDSGSAGSVLYYVMPFVPGESLRDRLAREKQLPVTDALRIAREVASALGHAHRQGIVHRDIKPENLLLQDEHARVTDFGIARALTVAGGERMTRSGVMLGTPAYMSPEQTSGGTELDPRSDLYGLGCVLFEMLAGQPPFTAPTVEALVYQHLSVEPAPVTHLRPAVPAEVAALVRRLLAKNPADRPRDAAALTQELDAALARTTVMAGTTPAASAAPTEPAVPPAAAAPTPMARRVPRAALVAVAAIALIAASWLLWRGLATRRAPSATGAVAVMPFTVRGSDDLEYLGEGMVDLLSTSLDGAAELRRVDPHALLGFLRRREEGSPTPDRGAAVAAHFGAPMFVLGDVMQVGGRLRLQASLYDRTRGASPIGEASAEGDPAEITSLVDRLAAGLLSDLTGQRAGRLAQLGTVTTHSLAALKAYLQGERHFRRARYTEARDAFRAAVMADSTFALGWYRLSVAAGWLGGLPGSGSEARAAGERAVRWSARLTERDRRLLLARNALNAGRMAEAEREAQFVVQSHPDDAEAWVALGEALFHGNGSRGRPLTEARAPFERAVFLDPGAAEPLAHLFEVAIRERRMAAADSLAAAAESAGGDPDELVRTRMIQAIVRDDHVAVQRLMPAWTRLSGPARGQAATAIATHFGDPARAARLIPTMIANAPTPAARALNHAFHAGLLAAGGRWRDARAALRTATSLDTANGVSHGAFLLGTLASAVAEAELDSMREGLEAWRWPADADTLVAGSFHSRHYGYYPLARGYLLGLLAARRGEDEPTLARAHEIAALPGDEKLRTTARDLAGGLRALVARHRGDAAGALRILETNATINPLTPPSGFRSRTHERWLRAELLRELGRDDEALGWYEAIVATEIFETPYLAPSHLRRAEIHEKHGRTELAIHHYRRFLELWRDADPELRPELNRAQQRLKRLTTVRG